MSAMHEDQTGSFGFTAGGGVALLGPSVSFNGIGARALSYVERDRLLILTVQRLFNGEASLFFVPVL